MSLIRKVQKLNLESIHPAIVDSRLFPIQKVDMDHVRILDSVLIISVFLVVLCTIIFPFWISLLLFFCFIGASIFISWCNSDFYFKKNTKLFGGTLRLFSGYYRSEMIEKMKGEGYVPATLRQLLIWAQKNWNYEDIVIAAGSVCVVDGVEYVPVLQKKHIVLFEKKAELEFSECLMLGIKK